MHKNRSNWSDSFCVKKIYFDTCAFAAQVFFYDRNAYIIRFLTAWQNVNKKINTTNPPFASVSFCFFPSCKLLYNLCWRMTHMVHIILSQTMLTSDLGGKLVFLNFTIMKLIDQFVVQI